MEIRVMSAGEKIKQLRKEIGLKQEDLANDLITRSLISMIENNKRSLTAKTASIIAASLNRYYSELGIKITPEYLLESEEKQAQRLIIERYHQLLMQMSNPSMLMEVDFEESFRRLIIFAEQWHLFDVSIEIMETRGKYYYQIGRFNEALQDFFIAQEYYLRNHLPHQSASIYILIGSCHNHLKLYEQALLYLEQATHLVDRQATFEERCLKAQLSFERLLCFIGLQKYEMAIQEISYYKSLSYRDEGHYLQVLHLEANTYRDLKNYERAIQAYERLLKMELQISNNQLMMVYGHYALLCITMGDYQKGLQLIEKAYSYPEEKTADTFAHLSLYEAKCHLGLNHHQQAIEAIEKTLGLTPQISTQDLILELYTLLVELLIKKARYQRAEEVLQQLESFLLQREMKNQLSLVYSYLILLYCKINNPEKCLEQTYKLLALQRPNRPLSSQGSQG